MPDKVSLKQVEKKLYRATFQDGLIEIFIGSVTLMFAISPLLSSRLGDFWASFIFLPFWGLVWYILKVVREKIVVPRVGSVEFGRWRKRRMKKFTLLMLVFNLVVLGAGFFTFASFDRLTVMAVPFSFSLIMLTGFSLAAALLQQPRYYFYGLMFAAAPIFGEYLYQNYDAGHHGFPITFGFCAAVLFGVGLFMLIRLIVSHPDDTDPLHRGAE